MRNTSKPISNKLKTTFNFLLIGILLFGQFGVVFAQNTPTPDLPESEENWQNINENQEFRDLEEAHNQYDDQFNDETGKKIYPEQQKKPDAPVATAASAGKCVLAQLAANLAKKGFAVFAKKVSATLVNATMVPVYIPGLENKEVGTLGGLGPSEDGIGYCIANSIIQYISDSTIDWINSGFEGNPVFVDDPTRIFKDLRDDTINTFLSEFGEGILCEDFSMRVKLALVTKERPKKNFKCTYEMVDANIRNMKENGVFTFEGWDEITQNPQNNQIGAFLSLDSELLKLKATREGNLNQELTWGSGYLPWKDKDNKNRTVTPGKVVQSSIEKNLQLKSDRLVLADEFDEVIDALADQLMRQAIIGILGQEEPPN